MLPRLHVDGEVEVVDLDDLEEEVRRGRVPGGARLHHPPLTGDAWVPLFEIPRFRDALDTPDARLAAHLREGGPTLLAGAVTAVLAVAGTFQLLVEILGPRMGGSLFAWGVGFFSHASMGVGTLVFDGRWWTVWTSQLVHAGPMHLLPNLAVVGYAGYRLQRALGADGYAVVAASTLLVGALSVAILQDADVQGASLVGYGLWAGVIVAGFRFEAAIPPRLRRYYGFGSLPLFAVLFVASLDQEGVAHAAHLGGFAGGALATLLVRPAAIVPRDRARRVRRRNLLAALVLLLAPAPAGAALARLPAVVLGPSEPVVLQQAGIVLDLPRQLQRNPVRVLGRTGWTTGPNAAGAMWWAEGRAPEDDAAFAAFLAEALDARLVEPAEPLAAPAGWTHGAWRVRGEDGRGWWVERHLSPRGEEVLELGMLVRLDRRDRAGRRARVFAAVIDSVRLADGGDPVQLAR